MPNHPLISLSCISALYIFGSLPTFAHQKSEDLLIRHKKAMRQKLITLLFLLLVISLVCRDATSAASFSLGGFYTARRAGREWRMATYHHHQHKEVAPPGDKSTDQETQNTSNMEAEDIVYNIDYHGATTHPTPTPKHPTP